ncbi:hypothetical protein [Salinarimonas soli]|uniref:Histidine kinase n=1 Tax=Salinarimonas soli TaxID=1638099 RepID=A0A5B2VEY1_9HYPH|nr:hypothetical protein [Salinarimonas soli]KAA2236942.1 hypothetical protein F0L46_11760 [Salinarimonas soli]
MNRFVAAAMVVVGLVGAAEAKNFAVPSNDPALTMSVPDDWIIQKIDYGFSARTPNEDVVIYVEAATAKNLDAMLATNDQWMRDNGIKKVTPKQTEGNFAGLEATNFRYDTTDKNGPTRVDLMLLPGGKNRVIMFSIWGSEDERAEHRDAIDAIMGSVKSLN